VRQYKENLTKFQNWLNSEKLEAYIVPHADEFQSEYLSDGLDRVYKLTGFKGSAGFAIILKGKALFFTDGRYILQAQQQKDYGYVVLDVAQSPYISCLLKALKPGSKVGYDPALFTVSQIHRLKAGLKSGKIEVVPIVVNPVDKICGDTVIPKEKLFLHPKQYTGLCSLEKRLAVMEKTQAQCLLIADPCSIAWLLNLRSRDIPGTPIFLGYALLYKGGHCDVFIEKPEERVKEIQDEVVSTYFHSLTDIKVVLSGIKGKLVSLDPEQVSIKIASLVDRESRIEEKNPCLLLKACKNVVEQKGMKSCHIRDAVAVVKFLFWLDQQFLKKAKVTEYEAARKIDKIRASQDLFVETSFSTISATGANGAIVHYCVEKKTAKNLEPGDIYLVDSGGQYLDGTTDITRTVLFGRKATEKKKELYTRVLKGHIAIAAQVFPKHTSGAEMDILGRKYLWEIGCDYPHSTGHGVGCFLSVHENPPSISRKSFIPFQEGMIVSNEPGYYKEGHYGIRIENLLTVEKAKKKEFFHFSTITMVPFDKRLIKKSLLNKEEVQWINRYHKKILKVLEPTLINREEAIVLRWLKRATSEL